MICEFRKLKPSQYYCPKYLSGSELAIQNTPSLLSNFCPSTFHGNFLEQTIAKSPENRRVGKTHTSAMVQL